MQRMYRHIAVIGIDGMGVFNKNTPTPFMDEIFKNGAVTCNALSMAPTISAQNWGAMLLGASPAVHGLTNSIISHKKYSNEKLPSVFARIRAAIPEAVLASFCNWEPINYGLIEHGIGVKKVNCPDNDVLLCERIYKCVSDEKPDFLFVQFDETDSAGHRCGYGENGHLKKITETDVLVGRIFEAYEDAGIIDDTLFITITDHGGIRVGHGGYTDSEKYVFFAVRGKTVKSGEFNFAYTKDIAAIVLYALGIDVPEYDRNGFSSQVPTGIFENTRDYFIPEAKSYNIATRQTPEFGGKDGLSGYISADKIKLAVSFDETMADAAGKNTPTVRGNIKYYNGGINGSFAEVGITGNACYENIKIGNESFSLCFWAKIDHSLDGCPAVCGNKDWFWKNSAGKGFVFSFRNSDTMLNIADGNGNCEEYIVPFPEDITEGWIHTTAVLDKEKKEYRCYYNFKHHLTVKVDDELIFDLDAMPFCLGDDGLGEYNSKVNKSLLCLDDFILFGEALNEDDINALKKYYGWYY